jgi:hypothetical protein
VLASTRIGVLASTHAGELAVAAVIAAQLAAGLSGRAGDPVALSWVLLVMGGLVGFLATSSPVRVWRPLVLLVMGVAVAVVGLRHGMDTSVANRVGGTFFALATLEAILLMFIRICDATVGVTVRAARAEVDLAAERATTISVRHDRWRRLQQLADGPIPLLADIGAGVLDPRDPVVCRRCASCAAALRRTLTRQLRQAALVEALEPAIRAAERRGVCIELQVAGNIDGIPAPVATDIIGAFETSLAGISCGRVLVTLIGGNEDGSLILTFAAPEAGLPEPGAPPRPPVRTRWVDVVEEVEDGRVCVEILWGSSRVTDTPD